MSTSEDHVPSILRSDGISLCNFANCNKEICNLEEIIASMPSDTSWSYTLVNSDSNSATLLAQLPGEGNRLHFHPNWDEWWYIVRGSWLWEIDGVQRQVNTGDFIFMQRGRIHKIIAIGTNLSIRLAVSRYDVEHVYP